MYKTNWLNYIFSCKWPYTIIENHYHVNNESSNTRQCMFNVQ